MRGWGKDADEMCTAVATADSEAGGGDARMVTLDQLQPVLALAVLALCPNCAASAIHGCQVASLVYNVVATLHQSPTCAYSTRLAYIGSHGSLPIYLATVASRVY